MSRFAKLPKHVYIFKSYWLAWFLNILTQWNIFRPYRCEDTSSLLKELLQPGNEQNLGILNTGRILLLNDKNFKFCAFEAKQSKITRGECILSYFCIAVWSVVSAMTVTSKWRIFGKNPPCFRGHFFDWLCIRARSPDI